MTPAPTPRRRRPAKRAPVLTPLALFAGALFAGALLGGALLGGAGPAAAQAHEPARLRIRRLATAPWRNALAPELVACGSEIVVSGGGVLYASADGRRWRELPLDGLPEATGRFHLTCFHDTLFVFGARGVVARLAGPHTWVVEHAEVHDADYYPLLGAAVLERGPEGERLRAAGLAADLTWIDLVRRPDGTWARTQSDQPFHSPWFDNPCLDGSPPVGGGVSSHGAFLSCANQLLVWRTPVPRNGPLPAPIMVPYPPGERANPVTYLYWTDDAVFLWDDNLNGRAIDRIIETGRLSGRLTHPLVWRYQNGVWAWSYINDHVIGIVHQNGRDLVFGTVAIFQIAPARAHRRRHRRHPATTPRP